MRTTIDLPEDLHRVARAIALDTGQTLSATVAVLMRRGLGETGPSAVQVDEETGLPVVHLGRPITSEDVAEVDEP